MPFVLVEDGRQLFDTFDLLEMSLFDHLSQLKQKGREDNLLKGLRSVSGGHSPGRRLQPLCKTLGEVLLVVDVSPGGDSEQPPFHSAKVINIT